MNKKNTSSELKTNTYLCVFVTKARSYSVPNEDTHLVIQTCRPEPHPAAVLALPLTLMSLSPL